MSVPTLFVFTASLVVLVRGQSEIYLAVGLVKTLAQKISETLEPQIEYGENLVPKGNLVDENDAKFTFGDSLIVVPPKTLIYVPDGQIPYQVSLQVDRQHFCSGAILNSFWILTAAHCLTRTNNKSIEVLAGSVLTTSNEVRRNVVSRVVLRINQPKIYNDIVLLKLNDSLPTNDPRIRPVNLPKSDTSLGVKAIVSGWSLNETLPKNILQAVNATTISNLQCQSLRQERLVATNICAYTRPEEGFCQGDTGGPLVDQRSYIDGAPFQIGILSVHANCGRRNPSVYTRLYPYVQEIKKVIKT